jgi:hypothetical protein
MKDIIQALKENEKPFGLMSAEMQEAIQKQYEADVGSIECIEHFSNWVRCGSINPKENQHLTYRLRPDYEPEPEVVKCPIREPDSCNMMWFDVTSLGEAKADSHTMDFCSCTMHKDFIGFLYEDGTVIPMPRKYSGEGAVKMLPGWNENLKVLTPTHVLFRKKNN